MCELAISEPLLTMHQTPHLSRQHQPLPAARTLAVRDQDFFARTARGDPPPLMFSDGAPGTLAGAVDYAGRSGSKLFNRGTSAFVCRGGSLVEAQQRAPVLDRGECDQASMTTLES